MHWGFNDGWSSGNWMLMTIMMALFWGFGAWAFVRLARSPDRSLGDARRTPEQILADRFAAGEIDTDEFHHRLGALRTAPVRDSVGR